MRFLMSLSIFVMLTFSAPASAAVPDASGAETLQTVLGNIVHMYSTMLEPTGSSLGWKGEIKVEPQDSFYTATIPDVRITSAAGFTLKIGDVKVNAYPGGVASEKGAWVISAALAPAIEVIDAAGDKVTEISIGGQRFSGVWVPFLDTFTRLDIEYTNLATALTGTAEYKTDVGSFRYAVNLTQDTDGLWSGPRIFEVGDLDARVVARGRGSYTLKGKRLVARSSFAGLALKDISVARARRVKILNDNQPATSAEAITSLLDEVSALSEDYTVAIEIESAEMAFQPDNPAAQLPPLRAMLGRASGTASMIGVHSKVGSLSAALGVEKLTFEGLPEPLAGMVPNKVSAHVALEGLPMKTLLGTFKDILQDAAAGSADRAASAERMRKLVSLLPAAMKEEGTRLEIFDTELQSRDIGLRIDSKIVTDPSSPVIVVGNLTLALQGLDELIIKFRDMAANNPMVQQYMQGLIPAQLAGKLSKPENDRSVRTYAFEIAPDGKILLNGADVSLLQSLLLGGRNADPMK